MADQIFDNASYNGHDPSAPSKTVSQVLVGAGPDGMLPPGAWALAPVQTTQWLRKVRLMRRDATIGLLRDLYMAALLGAEWSIECDDDRFRDAVDDITESTLPFRIQFLIDALRGFMDFGWQPYEVVKEQREDGTYRVTKYKGLLQDLTTILVDFYGGLLGLRNIAMYNQMNPGPVYLYRGDMCCLYRDAEGTNWYGEPLMRRVETPYDSWNECDRGARRFDNKIAGAHWIVYYPVGTSILRDASGNSMGETDNFAIAQTILQSLQSSGQCAVPSMIAGQVDDLNSFDPSKAAWRVELLSPNTQQAAFVDRGKYLDSLKARGFGFPERAILEGQFGTKAEAEAHADFMIDNLEMTHRMLLTIKNRQVVNPLLELNHGPEYVDKVRVVASPLTDVKRAALRALYEKHWSSDTGAAQESDAVDWQVVRDKLDIPVRKGSAYVQGPAGILPQEDPDAGQGAQGGAGAQGQGAGTRGAPSGSGGGEGTSQVREDPQPGPGQDQGPPEGRERGRRGQVSGAVSSRRDRYLRRSSSGRV